MPFIRWIFVLGALVPAGARAQDVTAVLNALQLVKTATAAVFSVTASQGDGTTCTANKLAGATVQLAVQCSNAGAADTLRVVRASGMAATAELVSLGDVACFILLNPTTAAVTMGSLGPAPAGGAAWSCSTNIRTSGSVSGQTALVAGSVSWP